ncbi:HvfC/BufC N-terminal domain-containing protein [Glaciecola petra]|uniref:DNA-binding domain-containing protein n=1 Tax=Glaciecola petra TaxID=3075602 RepID=A0ABU2ZPP3_9ALTE|nr:DNA-binding domain-containing protein [Aestuariibacter sp. P117]MDT0593569.1 DNA-binding domain-containing protein [Aestuariibacter sp. P117]
MKYQTSLIEHIFSSKSAHGMDHLIDEAQNAIDVYHNNYIENGIRALAISFSSVAAILEEQDFRKLCHGYLLQYPKTCFDWADYGANFNEYILSIDVFAEMPFLPELAILDWHLMHAERSKDIAFDADSFTLLQTRPADQLTFIPATSLIVIDFLFPVVELYQLAHDENLQTNESARHLQISKINNLINDAIKSGITRSIVVWRAEYKAEFEYVQKNEIQALNSLNCNESIEQILSVFGEDQASMSAWLQSIIQTKKVLAIKAS